MTNFFQIPVLIGESLIDFALNIIEGLLICKTIFFVVTMARNG